MTIDGHTKSVELERGKESFASLKSALQAVCDPKSITTLRYQNARGEIYEVGSDQQLERVLKENSSIGVNWLELKTASSTSYTASAPSSAASTPSKSSTTAASATHTPTKTSNYTPAASPASYAAQSPSSAASGTPGNRTAAHSTPQPGEYHIVTWNVSGDSSAPISKPKISYAQSHDEFSFWPLPCVHDSEIRVVLREGSTLVFESVYSFEDVSFGGQKGISTAKVTQTIGLPIKVGPNLISVEGLKIIIKH